MFDLSISTVSVDFATFFTLDLGLALLLVATESFEISNSKSLSIIGFFLFTVLGFLNIIGDDSVSSRNSLWKLAISISLCSVSQILELWNWGGSIWLSFTKESIDTGSWFCTVLSISDVTIGSMTDWFGVFWVVVFTTGHRWCFKLAETWALFVSAGRENSVRGDERNPL